jgi:hypothetical protein
MGALQTPFAHRLPQHCSSSVHTVPFGLQGASQMPRVQIPLQHCDGVEHWVPGTPQEALERPGAPAKSAPAMPAASALSRSRRLPAVASDLLRTSRRFSAIVLRTARGERLN